MLKKFIPKNTEESLPSRKEIEILFQKAEFTKALKKCRKSGFTTSDFQYQIEIGARRAVNSRNPGTLLSILYKNELKVQYSIHFLLMEVFKLNDYHGFLKDIYRFNIYEGFDHEIELAISYLGSKGQNIQAEAWRRKIDSMCSDNNK